jgi:polyisoprenyl-teichoic acid--peptidoglycan teichoic acid transferase
MKLGSASRRTGPGRRRTWPQRCVLAGGALLTGTAGLGALLVGYLHHKAEQIPRVELGHVLADPVSSSEPRNVLLVGVDDASGFDSDDGRRRGRDSSMPLADTIMVLRLDPGQQEAALVSFPRDLWVTFPETQARARINTAIWRGEGRPDVLIDLLDQEFDIPVHSYVQVDMAGFVDLVDLLDGVPVHFERPGRDQWTGFQVDEPGCTTLGPEESLAYVRSRRYQHLVDGEWEREGLSDLARVERQQDFIYRTVDRAISRGARNPGTLNRLVDTGLSSLTVDDELSVRDIVSLGRAFQEFEADGLVTYTLPVEDGQVGGADVVHMVEFEAEPILDIFRSTPPPGSDVIDGDLFVPRPPGVGVGGDMNPALVTVSVLNGSGNPGEAGTVGTELAEAGFNVVSRDNAGQFGLGRTEVRYPAGLVEEAASLERWLVAGAELVETSEVATVTLVTGQDWRGVRSGPRITDNGVGTGTDAEDDGAPADGSADPDAGTGEDPTSGGSATGTGPSDTTTDDRSGTTGAAEGDGVRPREGRETDADADADATDDQARPRVAC